MFGGNYKLQEEIISSRPITISVNDLPSAPEKFNGAVGKMSLISSVDRSNLNTNEAINYKLTIIGNGNLELIEPIKIEFPEDFEVYDPKISEKIFEGGMQRSTKTFEYLLIPRFKGKYIIPSASLITYNPKLKKYETKTSNEHEITVATNPNEESEYSSFSGQKIVKTKQKDINYIALKTNLKPTDKNKISKKIFNILFLLPILIYILFLVLKKRNNSNEKNINNKNRKAKKIAQKRLKIAKKCIKNKDFDFFYEEIEKSLWGYFADKFKVDSSQLSKETINRFFKLSNIDDKIKDKFISLLNDCEFARYSPSNNNNSSLENILEKSESIIVDVETELK